MLTQPELLAAAGLTPPMPVQMYYDLKHVGFVNVVESKERIWSVCQDLDVPAIVAMGRKGGSTVAAAVCNALLYQAAGLR